MPGYTNRGGCSCKLIISVGANGFLSLRFYMPNLKLYNLKFLKELGNKLPCSILFTIWRKILYVGLKHRHVSYNPTDKSTVLVYSYHSTF